jgi:uncharacterized protein YrrD
MTQNTAVLDRANALTFRSLKDLTGYKVMATDGEMGKVADFYFDDDTWTLRYFVVETGSWLAKRKVLTSPAAFIDSDGLQGTISTTLTRRQIEDAPQADLDKPVSRQFEILLHNHFLWPKYWTESSTQARSPAGDSHLRSMKEVLGYGIRAQDGTIGHVEDLIAQERTWDLRYVVIDTRNWLPGRKVLVSPTWITDVTWNDKKVTVDLTREAIQSSPEYDPRQPVNRAYEEKLFDYYGRPKYWC